MSSYHSIILGGDWGTGKTTMAATYVNVGDGPVLFLDVDNKLHRMDNMLPLIESGDVIQWPITETLAIGTNIARLAGTKFDEGRDKFPTPRPKGYQQLSDYIDKLVADKCVVESKGKKVKVGAVVLDSYTTTNEHIKYLIMAANGAMAMTQPLYNVLLRNFETLNSTLLSLPTTLILIVHEKWDKDELSGRVVVRPMIEGSMAQKIGKDFEEFWYLKRQIIGKEVKFSCYPWGDSMRQGRTSRGLPTEVEPDFSKIYK